jgi:histidinol-phosphate phosphatase family protein
MRFTKSLNQSSTIARLNRAVFLDRDGTINEEVSYLADLTQLRLIEGASAAIGRLNQEAFKVVVVSNQSGVARGYLAEDSVQHVHSALRERLERAHAQVDAFYYCPHHPTEGIGPYRRDCHCRKPKPGMLERAARELQIDLNNSFIVGDRLSDLIAGHAVGCKPILVQTGFGHETQRALIGCPVQPIFIAATLLEACEWILRICEKIS